MKSRDIKFRAWDKVCKVIFVNEEIKLEGGNVWLRDTVHHPYVFVTEVELMQYTGLKDKNGIEIYEGDSIIIFGAKESVNVVYKNGAFGYFGTIFKDFNSFAGNSNFDFNNLEIEVIGNIYENPELLT